MNNNKILFVDLDGTLIKEDLSDLAFYNSLKKNPIKQTFRVGQKLDHEADNGPRPIL